jgi:tRNA uridine 5-carbamoylmethylation protein Kti12
MMSKRVVIMRGVPGSGKSTAAKWLARMSGQVTDQFWLEDKVLKFGTPSLGFMSIDAAKSGTQLVDTNYPHESLISAVIHSTDEYFVNKSGVYRFSPKGLWPNHNKNYKAFRDSVDEEIPLVIVDNTNTQFKEYKKYLEYAQNAGYWVSSHVMPHPSAKEAAARNTHGVPLEKIEQMIKRFE